MSIFRASTKSIGIIQLTAFLLSIVGLFVAQWTLMNVLITVLAFYAYNSLGVALMFHRYWTHKSFAFRFEWMKWPLTLLAMIAGRGSPLAWVYVHRLHHAHSDTEKDPHSPHFIGYRFFGLAKNTQAEKMQIFMVKDLLTRSHILLNDYYLLIVGIAIFLLLLFSPTVFYFAWILPVALTQISQDAFNYFAHVSGYRNAKTKDKSTNVIWLWPLILGEAWHNNHHNDPKNPSTSVKWWEFDPLKYIIKLLT